ncbi:hypothetical protein [Paenibacillus naphthalenovorans]|uniref:hypothetical protein n=1 Tax=Paenibacillus naphthalenovorans TaxID=162209 RepID=UPI0010F51600|nr:hypothetical protein [Paenibacillus naphthalenovorans]
MRTMSAFRKIPWSTVRSVVFITSVIVYLVFTFFHFQMLEPLLSVLAVMAILISIPKSGKSAIAFTLLFLGGGTWFLWQTGASVFEYILSFGDMLYLLSLFAIVPVLAIPIKIGRYSEAIQLFLERKKRSDTQYYGFITVISFLMGSFLSLATVPIMYHSIKNSVEKWAGKQTNKFVLSSIIHGYAVSVAWAPVSGVLGVVLTITKVEWQNIMLPLWGISIGGLGASWLIYLVIRRLGPRFRLADGGVGHSDVMKEGESEIAVALEPDGAHAIHPTMKMVQIVWAIALLIVLVLTLNKIFLLSIVLIVTVIALPFAYGWSILLKKGSHFVKGTSSYVKDQLPAMSEQFAIFLSAGFFVRALNESGYHHYVHQCFVELNHGLGGPAFLILLPLLTLSFALAGVHPIAVITLLGESLNPVLLGLSPELLTIALTGGAVLTFLVGPFSGTIGVVSSLIGKSPFHVAGWSVWQALGFFLVLVIALLAY